MAPPMAGALIGSLSGFTLGIVLFFIKECYHEKNVRKMFVIRMQFIAETLDTCLHDEPAICVGVDFSILDNSFKAINNKDCWELYKSIFKIFNDWHRGLLYPPEPNNTRYKSAKANLEDILKKLSAMQLN